MGRVVGFVGVVIAVAVSMFIYSKMVQSDSAAAGANDPKAAVNLTGVRSDLISIATAERRYYATEGKYASFDELVSSSYITITRQRPPYSYEIQTTAGGFKAVATRSGANTAGTPSQFSVDENMDFQTSEE